MISIVIIGGGNVGYHLTNAFLKTSKVNVNQVFARNIQSINYLKNKIPITNNIEELINADMYILAISDDVIAKISSKITNKKALVVHTSGSISLKTLQNKGRKGVFYPLQSFSKNSAVNFAEIPFCLETENKSDFILLERLASSIGKKIYCMNSFERKQLHIASVFVNNFVNHLYKIGNDICNEHNVPFEILSPLIKETAEKIKTLSPKDAQTGPAKRNDIQTIKNHLELLNENQQKIYTLLTKSIQNNGKKL